MKRIPAGGVDNRTDRSTEALLRKVQFGRLLRSLPKSCDYRTPFLFGRRPNALALPAVPLRRHGVTAAIWASAARSISASFSILMIGSFEHRNYRRRSAEPIESENHLNFGEADRYLPPSSRGSQVSGARRGVDRRGDATDAQPEFLLHACGIDRTVSQLNCGHSPHLRPHRETRNTCFPAGDRHMHQPVPC